MKNKFLQLVSIWNSISKRNKVLIIAMLVMLIIVVPLTIVQSLNNQTTKQRASEDNVVLQIYSDKNFPHIVGNTFSASVNLINSTYNPKDIFSVDIAITYDPAVLELVNFDTENNYDFLTVINDQTPGSIRFVGVRTSTPLSMPPTLLRIGALAFKAKETSSSTAVSFTNATINASGYTEGISFTQEPQSYVISLPQVPSPTPTSVPAGGSSGSDD